MPVTKRTRYEVLKRDNHTCRYCGASAPDATLTVDHVTPVALGGTDDPSNLVAACRDCNAGKASTSPDDGLAADVAQADLKWAGAIKRVAAKRARQAKKRDKYVEEFYDYWRTWKDGYGDTLPLPGGWESSVTRFYELDVPIAELIHCATVACGNQKVNKWDTFRYFAGCVWKVVTRMQDDAKAMLEQEAQRPTVTSSEVMDLTRPDYAYAAGWWSGWHNSLRVQCRLDPLSAVVDKIAYANMPVLEEKFGIHYWNGVLPLDEYDQKVGAN